LADESDKPDKKAPSSASNSDVTAAFAKSVSAPETKVASAQRSAAELGAEVLAKAKNLEDDGIVSEKVQIVLVQEYTESVAKLKRYFDGDSNINVYESAIGWVPPLTKRLLPCLVIGSAKDSSEIIKILSLLKSLRQDIREKLVKFIMIGPFNNPMIIQKFEEFGCHEFIIEPISEKSLIFKLNLQTKAALGQRKMLRKTELRKREQEKKEAEQLEKKKLKKAKDGELDADDDDYVDEGADDDLDGDDEGTSKKKNVKEDDASPLGNDVWVFKKNKPARQGGNWVMRMKGPNPKAGEWQDAGKDKSGETRWRYMEKDPVTGELKKGGEGWEATGEKPEFTNGEWTFKGKKPSLGYVDSTGKKEGSKFNVDADGKMRMTKDTSAALAKADQREAQEAIEKQMKKKNLLSNTESREAKELVFEEKAKTEEELEREAEEEEKREKTLAGKSSSKVGDDGTERKGPSAGEVKGGQGKSKSLDLPKEGKKNGNQALDLDAKSTEKTSAEKQSEEKSKEKIDSAKADGGKTPKEKAEKEKKLPDWLQKLKDKKAAEARGEDPEKAEKIKDQIQRAKEAIEAKLKQKAIEEKIEKTQEENSKNKRSSGPSLGKEGKSGDAADGQDADQLMSGDSPEAIGGKDDAKTEKFSNSAWKKGDLSPQELARKKREEAEKKKSEREAEAAKEKERREKSAAEAAEKKKKRQEEEEAARLGKKSKNFLDDPAAAAKDESGAFRDQSDVEDKTEGGWSSHAKTKEKSARWQGHDDAAAAAGPPGEDKIVEIDQPSGAPSSEKKEGVKTFEYPLDHFGDPNGAWEPVGVDSKDEQRRKVLVYIPPFVREGKVFDLRTVAYWWIFRGEKPLFVGMRKVWICKETEPQKIDVFKNLPAIVQEYILNLSPHKAAEKAKKEAEARKAKEAAVKVEREKQAEKNKKKEEEKAAAREEEKRKKSEEKSPAEKAEAAPETPAAAEDKPKKAAEAEAPEATSGDLVDSLSKAIEDVDVPKPSEAIEPSVEAAKDAETPAAPAEVAGVEPAAAPAVATEEVGSAPAASAGYTMEGDAVAPAADAVPSFESGEVPATEPAVEAAAEAPAPAPSKGWVHRSALAQGVFLSEILLSSRGNLPDALAKFCQLVSESVDGAHITLIATKSGASGIPSANVLASYGAPLNPSDQIQKALSGKQPVFDAVAGGLVVCPVFPPPNVLQSAAYRFNPEDPVGVIVAKPVIPDGSAPVAAANFEENVGYLQQIAVCVRGVLANATANATADAVPEAA
jgi:hypothetical protein